MKILTVSADLVPQFVGQDDPPIEPTIPFAMNVTEPVYGWGYPAMNPTGTLAAWPADAICAEGLAAIAQLATDNPSRTVSFLDYTPDPQTPWTTLVPGWFQPS